MEDVVRISEEAFRSIYEDSFRSWLQTYEAANLSADLPAQYLSAYNAFRHYPHLGTGLRLLYGLDREQREIYATGTSIWRSANPHCSRELRSFSLPAHFEVGTCSPVPIPLSIAGTPDPAFD
jgi:uncharacterized protein (DUF2267 family)